MNPWIVLDCGLLDHPKMAALPSDTARLGWIAVLLEAKLQRRPGEFAGEKHFRLVMGRFARYLTEYKRAGLLEAVEDRLLVHDWKRHQWAVAKAGQRETSGGHSEDISETKVGQKKDASRAVSVPVSISVSTEEGVQGEKPDVWELYCGLTGASRPSPNVVDWLTRLEDRYDAPPMAAAMIAEWAEGEERKTFLSRVERRLEKAASAAEVAAEEDIRSRRVQEKMFAKRVEWFRQTGQWDDALGPRPAA